LTPCGPFGTRISWGRHGEQRTLAHRDELTRQERARGDIPSSSAAAAPRWDTGGRPGLPSAAFRRLPGRSPRGCFLYADRRRLLKAISRRTLSGRPTFPAQRRDGDQHFAIGRACTSRAWGRSLVDRLVELGDGVEGPCDLFGSAAGAAARHWIAWERNPAKIWAVRHSCGKHTSLPRFLYRLE